MRLILLLYVSMLLGSAQGVAQEVQDRHEVFLRISSNELNMLATAIKEFEKQDGDVVNYKIEIGRVYDTIYVMFVGKDADYEKEWLGSHSALYPTFEVVFSGDYELIRANYSF